MKRILVTGGAGFIGSWLVRALLALPDAYEVTNLDILAYSGNLDNLRSVETNSRYRFVEGDICDEALVNKLMAETDICIHAAAQTHVDKSISGPAVFAATNVMGTQTLLEAARLNKIEKYIQISTDEVYGSLPLEAVDNHFSEDSPLKPSSPYSATKTAADLLTLSYYHTYKLPVCVTRCSNNYGPNQYPEKLMPLFILNALQDKPLPVYGNGLNIRDWIHVEDHNAAVIRVMNEGRSGEVYNIGGANEQTNLSITHKILDLLDKPYSLIKYVDDRPGHDLRYAINYNKIKTELGWEPLKSFDDGMTETVKWYLDNPEWVSRVREREQQALSSV